MRVFFHVLNYNVMKSQSLDKIKDLIINYIGQLYLIPPPPFEQEQSLTKRNKNVLILYRKINIISSRFCVYIGKF